MMTPGPYSMHGFQAVPVSARRERFGDPPTATATAATDDDDDHQGGVHRGSGARATFRVVGGALKIVCVSLGILTTVILAAAAFGYAVDSHRLLETLRARSCAGVGVGGEAGTPSALGPFPTTANFAAPPRRIELNPPPRKWRPFYHQWACGQSYPPFISNLLANGHSSFADESNYTDHFIHYTDIVRDYVAIDRLHTCAPVASQPPMGGGGAVTCSPSTTWGRRCLGAETATSTAAAYATRANQESPPLPCQTGWHSPATQEQMALEGHAYCSRFCDGFASTRYFNVRRDGQRIGCYCLSECLGPGNAVVGAINGAAGSNEWDVWALDEPGFVPKLQDALAL